MGQIALVPGDCYGTAYLNISDTEAEVAYLPIGNYTLDLGYSGTNDSFGENFGSGGVNVTLIPSGTDSRTQRTCTFDRGDWRRIVTEHASHPREFVTRRGGSSKSLYGPAMRRRGAMAPRYMKS
jgi:hypothetical protein